jgi:hypothetical protein
MVNPAERALVIAVLGRVRLLDGCTGLGAA